MTNIRKYDFPDLSESYYRIEADGLPTVYLIPKKKSTTYASLRVGFGSDDRKMRTGNKSLPIYPGTAHFIEHKIFANEDGTDAMETLGNLGADGNAYTSQTATCYIFSCHERFGEALRELLTFVTHPYFTEENVATEKEIILQEANMYLDSPNANLIRSFYRQIYRTNPIRDEIVGTPDSIRRMTPDYLYRVYRHFYCRSNMSLYISGDVTPEEVLSSLSGITVPENEGFVRAVNPPDPGYAKATVRSIRRNVATPLFAFGFRMPPFDGTPEENNRLMTACALINLHLFGDSGILRDDLRSAGLLSGSFSLTVEFYPGVAYVMINGESKRPAAMLNRVKAKLSRVLERGIAESDLNRLKRSEYARSVLSFDDTENIAEDFSHTICDGIDPFTLVSLNASVDTDYVNGVLRRFYLPSNLSMSVVKPLENQEKE